MKSRRNLLAGTTASMVHHLRHPTVTEHPLGEGQAFIAYAEQALAMVAHQGKRRGRGTVPLLGLGRYWVENYGTSPEFSTAAQFRHGSDQLASLL
jgi:hypothetical protein